MVENSVPRPKIFEMFISEFEFRLFLTNEEKKLICMVTQKCVLKNFQKQQCCIYVGWSLKKVAVKSTAIMGLKITEW